MITIRKFSDQIRPPKGDENRMLKGRSMIGNDSKTLSNFFTIRQLCGQVRSPKVDENRMLKKSKHDRKQLKNVIKNDYDSRTLRSYFTAKNE